MDKQKELKKIAREIEKCSECKIGKTGLPVAGEGNPNAKVMFVGEAPGKTEAKTGRPFVGRSGKLLRSLIDSIGFEEDDVYITSPVKYLPLAGTPTLIEIKHGKIHLDKQIDVINPKLIVLLGATAVKAVLEYSPKILNDHGQIIEKDDRRYFITLHPAAALRFPKLKSFLEKDFLNLKSLL